jgi:branched-chain amino acid aminotransferase
MCDLLGNVAELATANIFMVKDGVVLTPAPNGTFLAGITRARVMKLLRAAGISVIETTLSYTDFQSADEIFSSGNYTKVSPIVRIDERNSQPGPVYRKARELYLEYAHAAQREYSGTLRGHLRKAGLTAPLFFSSNRFGLRAISLRLHTSRRRDPN